MHVKQVLITTLIKTESIIDPGEFYESKETRLIYTPMFTKETPSMQEFCDAGKMSMKDKKGNLIPHAELMKAFDKLCKEHLDKNKDAINAEIDARTDEHINKTVREYYGDRFISVEIHETIGMKQSLGLA